MKRALLLSEKWGLVSLQAGELLDSTLLFLIHILLDVALVVIIQDCLILFTMDLVNTLMTSLP